MKRTTLILLALAVAFGVSIYYLDIREGKTRDEPATAETTKPAFSFSRDDIAAIAVSRSGQNVTIEEHDGKWLISQPVNAAADQSTIDSLIGSLTTARIERNLPADSDKM